MPRKTVLFCMVVAACDPGLAAAGPPSIEITAVPPYGVDGLLHGTVTGVEFGDYRVAPYIQIEGVGWWTKPTLRAPTVPILPDGTFRADVATGGLDNRATIYLVALIGAEVSPPAAEGAAGVPASLSRIALATDVVERYGRTLELAGRTWAVKEAPDPVGPGPNRFSFLKDDVFVDKAGALHIILRFHDGAWWSTEVILLDDLGFGTYSFTTASRLDILDANVTFGAFLWDAFGDEQEVPGSPNREFDSEDSRWGNPADATNAQFVVQPFDVCENLSRYTIPDLGLDQDLQRSFTWTQCQISFVAWSRTGLIHEFVYLHDPASDRFVPSEGRARFRFNLWLNNPQAGPADGQPIEVIITDFSFSPGEPGRPCPWDLNDDTVVGIVDFLGLLASWNTNPGGPPDFDGDCVVGITDFLELLARWGPCL